MTGCGRGSESPGYVSGDSVIEQVAVADRTTLPATTGELLGSGTYDSRDYAGRVEAYNVWGSWCAPCRKEAPDLQRVWRPMRNRGVQFVGVDVKDNDTAAVAFEREFGVTYPSINIEASAAALPSFASSLPANAVPSTLVVDPVGRVAARVIGKTTYTTLIALVRDVLAESSDVR